MTEVAESCCHSECFKKLSSEHQELWLNINQNVEWINKLLDIDDDHYICVHCFEDLGYDMPDGFFHSDGYCASYMCNAIYCDKCVEELKLEMNNGIINGDIMCPVCWYFQIKNCVGGCVDDSTDSTNSTNNCLKHKHNTPTISLNQWQFADLPRIKILN